jgi:adenine-specific DNA-methyltransferase
VSKGKNMANQPDKLDLKSPDVNEEKKRELLRLFPEIRTEEGKIDFERLKLALGETVDVGKERYGMNWPGKAACFQTIREPSLATLRPSREESVNFDSSENLIIEGDNLEVLKLLQKSYLGKIKMIYIDPPYNTGNDFIYPDNYTESLQTYLEYTGQVDVEGRKFGTNTDRDGRFHSKWMNMMYPRLYLARNLLREDGFIAISIDDAELRNLEIVLNEVFGEENFIAVLVYDRNRKNDAKLFSIGHEYMVVYGRNKGLLTETNTILRAPKEGIEEIRGEFERLRKKNGESWDAVSKGLKRFYSSIKNDDPKFPLTRYNRVDERGPFRTDGNPSWPGGGGPRYAVLHPITGKAVKIPSRGWVWPTYGRMKEEIDKGNIMFGPDETTIPGIRMDLFEKDRQVMRSVIFSYAQKASQDFARIFDGKAVFDNPKNYIDIGRIIEYLTASDDLIIDIFAGSGTTAHSVVDLNERNEGSHRKFILVQLPEPLSNDNEDQKIGADFCDSIGKPRNIAEICKERVRRVILKLNVADTQRLDLGGKSKQDRGFRVFKLAESNFKPWNAQGKGDISALEKQLELHIKHIRDDRTPEDILYELLLKSGFPLTTPVDKMALAGKTVYSLAGGAMFICLEHAITLELIRAMAGKKPERVVCLDEGFAGNDQLKANAVQIFKTKGITSFKTV